MKAILLMEMPEKCTQCPAMIGGCAYCAAKERWIVNARKKPDWCPLVPLPERKIAVPGYEAHIEAKGWNACLDAIEGGNG